MLRCNKTLVEEKSSALKWKDGSRIWNLGLVKILSLSLVKFLNLIFDQNLCQKL